MPLNLPLAAGDKVAYAVLDILSEDDFFRAWASGSDADMAVDPAGTVTIPALGTTITGAGTNFRDTARKGFKFLLGDPTFSAPGRLHTQRVTVASDPTSDTTLEITEPHIGGVLAPSPLLRAPRIERTGAPELPFPDEMALPHLAIGIGTGSPETPSIGHTVQDPEIVIRFAVEQGALLGPGEASWLALVEEVSRAVQLFPTLCVPRFGDDDNPNGRALALTWRGTAKSGVPQDLSAQGGPWFMAPGALATFEGVTPATIRTYDARWTE